MFSGLFSIQSMITAVLLYICTCSYLRAKFTPDDHTRIQLLTDHTPVEPNSPDNYQREFLDGTDGCWANRGCETLRTLNDVTKTNAVFTIPYVMNKDFRWIDLNLPTPSEVPAGEVAV